jgi:dihydrofolate reductase
MVYSMDEAIRRCDEDQENFVIGGASVYRQFLPYTSRLYLTLVHKSFDADTYFPEIVADEWEEISRIVPEDEGEHDFTYEFIVLQRKD